MEDDDSSDYNTRITDQQAVETTASGSDPVIEPATSVEQKGQTKKPRFAILVIVGVILLALGGVYAWYALGNDDTTQQTAGTAPPIEESQSDAATNTTPKHLYMQLNTTISEYNPVTGQASKVTSAVPAGTKVIDFYRASDTEWRYYSTSLVGGKIYYADQSTDPILLQSTQNIFNTVANAQMKMYAYVTIDGPELTTTKTYLVKNNASPQLLYESSNKYFERSSDVDDPHYVVQDMSAKGDQLLYQQAVCFNCGGGYSSNMFTLDINTGVTKVINVSDAESDGANFDDESNVLYSSGTFNRPWLTVTDVNVASYKIAQTTQEIFRTTEPMESYALSHKGDFALSRLKAPDYADSGNTAMGSLYKLNENEQHQYSVDFGEYNSAYEYNVGKSSGDCVSAYFYERTFPSNSVSGYDYSVGAICKETDSSYVYRVVDKDKFEQSNSENTRFVIAELL